MPPTSHLSPLACCSLPACSSLLAWPVCLSVAQIYDPNNTGYIDLEVFREILTNLGFGDITEQDIQTLIDTADVRQNDSTAQRSVARIAHSNCFCAPAASDSLTCCCTLRSAVSVAQVDGDGRVSLADFRRMLPSNTPAPPATAGEREKQSANANKK